MDRDVTTPESTQPSAVEVAPAVPAPPPQRRAAGARILNIVLGFALALAVGGLGFAAGRFTAPAPAFPNGNRPGGGQVFNGGTGGQGPAGAFAGGATVEGTVESVTATTMTIKTASGQTIQIAIDGSTTYHAQTDATSTDVAPGGKVLVRLDGASFGGGPNSSAAPIGGPTARDVTVVP